MIMKAVIVVEDKLPKSSRFSTLSIACSIATTIGRKSNQNELFPLTCVSISKLLGEMAHKICYNCITNKYPLLVLSKKKKYSSCKAFSRDSHDTSINEMVKCELYLMGSKLTE